jgi:ABC-2 type transport system ATP-binding protein
MDEAERCHELAYIAYGKLLARGTAAEVVAQSGLATWSVSGSDLQHLARELRALPGIDMVVPFGTTLHISSTDAAALKQVLAPYFARAGLNWSSIEPSLEDVFISLMSGATDNFQ